MKRLCVKRLWKNHNCHQELTTPPPIFAGIKVIKFKHSCANLWLYGQCLNIKALMRYGTFWNFGSFRTISFFSQLQLVQSIFCPICSLYFGVLHVSVIAYKLVLGHMTHMLTLGFDWWMQKPYHRRKLHWS